MKRSAPLPPRTKPLTRSAPPRRKTALVRSRNPITRSKPMQWRKGGIRRDKYDVLFSELVRERAAWCCERCGRDFSADRGALDCSHIFGRRKESVRIHPDNALAACRGCHRHLSEHPIDHAELVRQKLGPQRYERLRVLAGTPTKFTPAEKELIHAHYLKERRRMQEARKAGIIGRLEFTLPG